MSPLSAVLYSSRNFQCVKKLVLQFEHYSSNTLTNKEGGHGFEVHKYTKKEAYKFFVKFIIITNQIERDMNLPPQYAI